jgi:hypothetical protein
MKKKELFLRRGLIDSGTMKREDVQAVESIQEKGPVMWVLLAALVCCCFLIMACLMNLF